MDSPNENSVLSHDGPARRTRQRIRRQQRRESLADEGHKEISVIDLECNAENGPVAITNNPDPPLEIVDLTNDDLSLKSTTSIQLNESKNSGFIQLELQVEDEIAIRFLSMMRDFNQKNGITDGIVTPFLFFGLNLLNKNRADKATSTNDDFTPPRPRRSPPQPTSEWDDGDSSMY